MRRRLPFLLVLALLGLAAAVALGKVGAPPPARAATVAASGAFEISNSKEGQPIFAASGIAPGGSATGTVAIEDTGSGPVALKLHRGELVDTPGLEGGLLSEQLRLVILDLTAPSEPQTVYSGPLASMPDIEIGELGPGQVRTYRFTATLPDEGSQNAVQGAATTVAYAWIAEEAEEKEEEGEEESGGGGGGGGTTPVTPGIPPSGGGGGVAGQREETPIFNLLVPRARRMIRGGTLVVWTNCNDSCRLQVRGRIRASAGNRHRGAKVRYARRRYMPAGAQRLRIPVPRHLRRWLRETEGRKRVRARLRFVAISADGERDVVRKTLRLRVRRP
jgi:hypothetical protein